MNKQGLDHFKLDIPMEILLNPNVAYLILAFTLVIVVLAILSPGTGFLEVAALFFIALMAWVVFNVTFNYWALGLLFIGVVLFFLAVRLSGQKIILALSILALVIGSAFLFPSDEWWKPAVNLFLAAIVSTALAGFFWLITQKTLESRSVRPTHDLAALIGEVGEAKTDIFDEGSVQLNSELWSAHSQAPIPTGSRVRVLRRDGFTLEVELESPPHIPPAE
jgi:membrane-bound serine protease (ClpP class)